MSKNYVKKNSERFCRSLDYSMVAGQSNPYALLASAVIAQAAVDCTNWSKDDPDAKCARDDVRKYLTFTALRNFINSDWIDMLLCWQHEVTPLSVCEELVRRLQT